MIASGAPPVALAQAWRTAAGMRPVDAIGMSLRAAQRRIEALTLRGRCRAFSHRAFARRVASAKTAASHSRTRGRLSEPIG